jgi:hypothetical protein
MKQKFRKLTFVKVDDEMPKDMKHFEGGFIGIVAGTHSQEYGGSNTWDYSVYQIENGKIVDEISWYNESQLTKQPNQDRKKAEEMIEEYNLSENY